MQMTPGASSGNPFKAILDVGAALVSSLRLEQVFANIAEKIGEAMMSWSVEIQTYDPQRDLLRFEACWCREGLSEADQARVGSTTPVSERPDLRRLLSVKELVERRIGDPDLPADERRYMEGRGYKATLSAPLMAGGSVIGVLGLAETRFMRTFTSMEKDLFHQLCDLAAVGIANAQSFRRMQEQTRHLDALLDSSRAVSSSVDLDQVLTTVAEKSAKALGCPECCIYQLDAATDEFIWMSLYPRTTMEEWKERIGTRYPLEEGDRRAFELAAPYVETLSDPDIAQESRASMEELGEKTVLNIPFIFESEPVGLMVLIETGAERHFTDDELELARGLGDQAAAAIRNAMAYRQKEEQGRRMQALLDASRATTSVTDLEELLAAVTRQAGLALSADGAAVYEYDAVKDTIGYRAIYERDETTPPDGDLGTFVPLADNDGERANLMAPDVVIEDLEDSALPADRRRNMEKYEENTTLTVPLRFGDTPLGLLRLYSYYRSREFTQGEIELARGLGEQAATAIWNARQFGRLERARRRTDTLLDASKTLTTSLASEDVFDAITRRTGEALGAPRCALYEFDAAAGALTARSLYESSPVDGYQELNMPEPLDKRPGDRVILDGGEMVVERVDDPAVDPVTRAEMEYWGERIAVNIPLVFRGERLGILMAIFIEDRPPFSEDELALASGLGEQAATALYNARLFSHVEHERQRTAALFEASRTLTSTLVRDEVYALVTARAAETFQAPRCDLYEYDSGADTLTLRGYFELEPSGLYASAGEPQPMAERPGDREILDSGEISVENVSDPEVDAATRAEMVEWGEKTCLNVPIRVKGEPLGLLIISETEHERVFSADELELARGLGEQVGMALQNARLYSRLETQNRRLLELLQSSREMTGAMDVEKTVETMCTEIAGLLDCPVCRIDVGLRDQHGDYVPPVVLAADEDLAANAEPSLEQDAVTTQALEQRQPVQAELSDAGRRLVIPLFAKDEPSGYVDLSGPAGTRFGDDEIEVVQILANQAAVAIDNALLLHEREKRAITDGLTGLFNHRYFYDRLHSEMARSLRYFAPLSLLILDVDDFKSFNDTYGHQAGDEVLHAIGELLISGVRQHIDIPCRYGGEEFAIILPNTPGPGARAVGERLQEGVQALAGQPVAVPSEGRDEVPVPLPNPYGAAIVGERIRHDVEQATFVDDAGSTLRHVTISVGVASFPDHAVNADALVAAADKALYEAKRSGKNRVQVWGGERPAAD